MIGSVILRLRRLMSGPESILAPAPDSYEAAFSRALVRSREWDFQPPGFVPVPTRYLTPASQEIFRQHMQDATGHLTARQVAAQCFAVHAFLRESLQETLGVPLFYTLGYVKFHDRSVFYTPIRQQEKMLREGVSLGSALNLHAWLTLPSHELIDLTFGTTVAVHCNMPEAEGRCMFLHPLDMTGGMTYHPQWVGEGYMRRLGVLLDF